MTPKIYPNFKTLWNKLLNYLNDRGHIIETKKWQGKSIENRTTFLELLNIAFQLPICMESQLPNEIGPNLPWADIHFKERIGGIPWNPGQSYKQWPFYTNKANDQFREVEGAFTHTYMERIWPKFAGKNIDRDWEREIAEMHLYEKRNQGIRYEYGDLADVIFHLNNDPYTRQAYLPIWFPEDTGVIHGGRVPCSIGYHFIVRNGYLYCTYQLRSCDLLRHFRDDVYLAMRLTHHILTDLKGADAFWEKVQPGMLNMSIGSLHVFAQEKTILKNHIKK